MNGKTWSALLAVVAAICTFIGTLIAPGETTIKLVPTLPIVAHTLTDKLGGPGNDSIPVPPEAQAIAATEAAEAKTPDAPGVDVESGLHETQQPIPAQIPQAAIEPPAGCISATVRNYSSRPAGARVLLGVIHWTGSSPTPGSPAGGQAIVHWFDDPRARASSNYVTDQDGRCWMTVPEPLKAWTQVNANPWSVSDEIVNIGTAHPLFQTDAAKMAVVNLMIGWHHRWGLPYRHAKVDGNCVPTVSGFLDHKDLGPCGGGHPDVDGYDLDGLIAFAGRVDRQGYCDERCQRAHQLRAKHQRTHDRFRKNECTPAKHGYCDTLRHRNKAIHLAARREKISLKGTY